MSTQELLAEIRKLPIEEQRRLLDALTHSLSEQAAPRRQLSDAEVGQTLLAKGVISEIPPRRPDAAMRRDFKPVEVKGQPISETIIEERR